MAFSQYLEQAVLNHMLRNQAFTPPATLYVALFTTTPTGTGTGGVEVTGGSYARQAIAFSAATGGNPATIINSALVQFPTASAGWGTVVGAGLYDAVSGGNLLEFGALAASKTIATGDAFAFPAGTYTQTLT
jgi:hypothetical protein